MKALTSNEWFEKLRELTQLEPAELIQALKPLHCRMESAFNYYKIFKQLPTSQQSGTLDYLPLRAAFIHLPEKDPAEKKHEIDHMR